MNATATDYKTLIESLPSGTVTILSQVDWDDYEEALRELDERPAVRLAYDQRIAGLFPHLIMAMALECDLNFIGARSTTLRKRKKEAGLEADDCYYFNNIKLMGQKKDIDLSVDPPPDLAFEVDITNPSLNKFPIYAAIGIPELWRYTGNAAHFYRLEETEYIEINQSDRFPFLSPDDLFSFLRIGEAEGTMVMVKEFREWMKEKNQ